MYIQKNLKHTKGGYSTQTLLTQVTELPPFIQV